MDRAAFPELWASARKRDSPLFLQPKWRLLHNGLARCGPEKKRSADSVLWSADEQEEQDKEHHTEQQQQEQEPGEETADGDHLNCHHDRECDQLAIRPSFSRMCSVDVTSGRPLGAFPRGSRGRGV